ncbi:MAG: hypothetical protein ACYTEQ_01580 [Planctomycetota bacterium]|jgi:hypothetical protein
MSEHEEIGTTSNIKLNFQPGGWQPYRDTVQGTWVYDWQRDCHVSDKGDKAIAIARLLVDSGYIVLPPEEDVLDLVDLIRSEL